VTLLVVNYHYVAAEEPAAPHAIFPVGVDAFAAQLEALGRTFEFVSGDDILRGELPERACLVTFDDGLREQFELALPVLDRLGVAALFFVPGRPLAEGRGLYVHKLHHLRERHTDEELLGLIGARVEDVPEQVATAHYAYDTAEAARVKYLLNVALPLEEREALVNRLFDEPEDGFCRRLYMSPRQVLALGQRGMLGSHAYAHVPLALLDPVALRDDLAGAAAVLERLTGERPRAISYPHGSAVAVTRAVAEAAGMAGFAVGFTMERALNATLEDPLLLARMDMNDVPGGSRPLLSAVGGELVVGGGAAEARSRYFAEAEAVSR